MLRNFNKGFFYGIFAVLLSALTACGNQVSNQVSSIEKPINIAVHVNQLAYESNGVKVAVISVAGKADLTAKTFQVLAKNGSAVYQGKLTAAGQVPEWQSAYQSDVPVNYYLADFTGFSSIEHNDNYRVSINFEGVQQQSAPFAIAKQALFRSTTSSLLSYFNGSRNDEEYNYQQDKHIRIFDTQRYVDVSGGWNDAGGDTGKYLSHLSYANYMNPQQLAMVGWALAYSYQEVPHLYDELKLTDAIVDEVFWGADYLHKILDPQGYFYMTVFDKWNTGNAERVVTAYVGLEGIYTEKYQSAFRQGAGSAIAALARASVLAKATGKQGQFSGEQYLKDAKKAFHHLNDNQAQNNKAYTDDGKENIIDDYTALLAAIELYKATNENIYLTAARQRADNLAIRLHQDGWFISNDIDSDNLRPFYHAAEAGFPVVSLALYHAIEPEKTRQDKVAGVISRHMSYQLALNNKVANPFNYARQAFKTYENDQLSTELQEGFFIPHANETNYWWQGESARLSSLSMAASLAKPLIQASENKASVKALDYFAQQQLDWTLGRNPYDLTMLNGFGEKNPKPYHGLSMVAGGISNGITGERESKAGRGIEWAPEPDWKNWRWVEQWLPHSTWFLLATTEMAK